MAGGEDPTAEVLVGTFEVPSVTAACMLIPRDVFHEVGKFNEAYVYGTEDVDLNLMIRQSGRSVYFCGQAALFHHESASQDELGSGVVRVNRMTNAQVFVDRWAPSLSSGRCVWTQSVRRPLGGSARARADGCDHVDAG